MVTNYDRGAVSVGGSTGWARDSACHRGVEEFGSGTKKKQRWDGTRDNEGYGSWIGALCDEC